MFAKLRKDQRGQALTEYGLIVGLLAVVAIGSLVLMRDDVSRLFTSVANSVDAGADAVAGAD